MNAPFQPALDFEAAEQAAHGGAALVLALDGYEGPLHLLLALARNQKVDLRQLSIARLAEQYLAFVESQTAQFGLAAEYLVMAAWLAYLKSRLLLPKPAADADEPPAEELAEALAFRLAKLDAMRQAAQALKDRPQFGRDVFARGDPEAVTVKASQRMEGSLYELMEGYAAARARPEARRYRPAARVGAYPIEAARERLKALLPRLRAWTTLERAAPEARDEGPGRRSCVASTFSAGLEMTKDGVLELRQAETFAALYLRARRSGSAVA